MIVYAHVAQKFRSSLSTHKWSRWKTRHYMLNIQMCQPLAVSLIIYPSYPPTPLQYRTAGSLHAQWCTTWSVHKCSCDKDANTSITLHRWSRAQCHSGQFHHSPGSASPLMKPTTLEMFTCWFDVVTLRLTVLKRGQSTSNSKQRESGHSSWYFCNLIHKMFKPVLTSFLQTLSRCYDWFCGGIV